MPPVRQSPHLESFEAIFGRPVQVRLVESKLGGAERCVFEVTLS